MNVRWFARFAVAIGLLLSVLAGGARADGSAETKTLTIALIDIEVVGNAGPEFRTELQAVILSAVKEEGIQVVSQDDVHASLRSRPDLADCVTPACVRALPDILGSDRFLRLWIEARGAAYSFELTLLGGEDGGVVQREQQECPVCTTREIIEQVGQATVALAKTARGLPVEITSTPAGARLRIDGNDVGQTPFAGNLLVGSHQVEATLDGYMPAEQTVEVTPRENGDESPQAFAMTLVEGQAPMRRKALPGRPFRTLKWAGAATAVAALGMGVVWLAVDGNGTCGSADQACPELYDTGTLGLVGLGAGAALGMATGYMFWQDGQDAEARVRASKAGSAAASSVKPNIRPGIMPLAGGAMGAVHVRF